MSCDGRRPLGHGASQRGVTRRAALLAGPAAGLLGALLARPQPTAAEDDLLDLVKRLTGRVPVESPRLRLELPAVFSNGYTVPMALEVESPMTEADHVRSVRVLAPRNPIIEVALFRFTPQSGRARVSTRIRLAEPQFVVALAELSGGEFLMAKSWVKVESNGCA